MDGLFLGGIFNITDPLFGFQLYIWSWLGLVVLGVVAAILLHFLGWKPLKPLHGLYYEWKNGGNAAFTFDADLRGELVSEREAKCIFDYSKWDYELPTDRIPVIGGLYRKFFFYYPTAFISIDPVHIFLWKFGGVNKDVEIARTLQNGEWERTPSVITGGVPVDIIIDSANMSIRTHKNHAAVERCAMAWNELNPDDQIHSYTRFVQYLIERKISCPEIKPYAYATWTRVERALPTEFRPNELAGKKMDMAIKADEHDTNYLNSIGLKILFCCVGVASLIMIVRAINLFLN